ncbi:MAG: CDP-glycerol glycerophosphotransferase family protein [Candidatus Thorarchaeota archaeon]|jgi:hypothetical protein
MTDKNPPEEQPNLPIIYTQGSHNLVPLFDHLKETYRFVIGHPTIAQIARDMGVTVANMEDALSPALLEQSRLRAMWLQQGIQHELLYGSLMNIDTSYPALSTPALQQWFPLLTSELMTGIITRLRALDTVVNEHGIAGVLVHEDVTAEGRSLVALGRKHGVPTMHMPHANHFIQPDTGDIHATTRAEFLGVAGNYMYNWYKIAGVADERMTRIGSPNLDKIYEEAERIDQPHARRCFGFDQEKPVWLYATSWAQTTDAWGEGQEDLFTGTKWFLQAAREAGAQVLLKLHPHENAEHAQRYLELSEKAGLYSVLTSHYLTHTLSASDVVITQGSSNLAVQATIMGKPVVEMLQPGTKYPEQYNIPGSWGPDLAQAVSTAMDQGPNEKFLADMNEGPESKERATEWIGGILASNTKV